MNTQPKPEALPGLWRERARVAESSPLATFGPSHLRACADELEASLAAHRVVVDAVMKEATAARRADAAQGAVVYACPQCGTGMEVDPAAKPSRPAAPGGGFVLVPEIGTEVVADHPQTCLNPNPTFEVVAVEVDSMGARARGENTCWFGVSLLSAAPASPQPGGEAQSA